MRLVKYFFAFLFTLLLFWITPRFNTQQQVQDYFDASAERFLVDHNAVDRAAVDRDPQITATVTSPDDTSTFILLLFYRQAHDSGYQSTVMSRVAGSYDLHAATLPYLHKGESYYYHFELKTLQGKSVLRLPEEPNRDISLLFEGTPSLLVWSLHVGLMYLAAIFAFLSVFDAVGVRKGEIKLKKLSRKVATVTFLLFVGGLVVGSLVSVNRYGFLWGGWPLGHNNSQTMFEVLVLYWLAMPVLFKGTIFKFRPEKNIVSPGGAMLLTLIGVLFMITVYLTGDHFVGIPLGISL